MGPPDTVVRPAGEVQEPSVAKQTLFDNTPVRAETSVPLSLLPAEAQVVIVGGGIAGASVAWHFAQAGWKDVVLLEQSQIASGTTWHSAGQVGQLRSSDAQTRVNKASAELFASLHEKTGHDPGWLQCGGLQLAACEERLHQLKRNAAMAKVYGVDAEVIAAEDCRQWYPMLHTDDLHGAVWLPGDGRVLPGECTVAMVKGAMARGVRVHEQVRVERLLVEQRPHGMKRITGVQTAQGTIKAQWVVLAGNMWMRQLGLQADIDIPVYPCEHHYVITRPIDGLTRNVPCTRDPDAGLYFRALDDGGLKLGAFKKRSKPWQIGDHVPNDFAFDLLEPDWPDFEEPFADHRHRLRGISRDDVVKFVNGPEAFTPDNNFLMGQPWCTDGLFVLGGWNSAGIACSGGAGRFAVEWIDNGSMTLDLGSVDIRRFLPFQNQRTYLQERVSEVLGLHYQMAWPGRQMETARGIRSASLYEQHKSLGACFGETAGWERPLWYAPKGCDAITEYSFVRQNWHDYVAEEVAACRERVGLLDQSTFAKFELSGSKALATLQWLCSANIDVPVGRCVYTAMLNSSGTFESDLTVIRTDEDHFSIITATAQQGRDFDWITRHLPDDGVTLRDVTEDTMVVSVMGPRSRTLLQTLTEIDLSHESFPFAESREIRVGGIGVRAVRLTYVGELGWELHVPAADAVALFDVLKESGAEHRIRPVGNNAISAMRIEKAYRAFGHELSPSETPLQAGLGFAVCWDKPFLGRDALLPQKGQPLHKRLVNFVLEDSDVILWGGEPILWNGQPAGYTTSACYGPTLGASVAMGYLRDPDGDPITAELLSEGTFHIQHLGQDHAARVSLRPFYDPSRGRILC